MGIFALPPNIKRVFAAWLPTWSRARGKKINIHDFGNGPHSGHGHPHRTSGNAGLGDGSVENPFTAESREKAAGHLKRAAIIGHILTKKDNALIPHHLLGKGFRYRMTHYNPPLGVALIFSGI
jgi:hypothetical protein